jgi:quercetin dioxygenase-like cupin family protein
MKTFLAMSRTYLVLTVLTALGFGGATLAGLANRSGTALTGQVLNDVPPPIVVDLIIKDSTDPTEANPGVYVDWHEGNDPNSTIFPVPIPASFAPGSLTITSAHPNVIYGDLNWSIPANVRVWWNQGGTWELVSNRAGYPTGVTETLYVQGMAPGSGPIVVTFTPETEATTPADDTVKVTVTKLDLDIDSNNDNQKHTGKGQVKVTQLSQRHIIEKLDGKESSATVLEVTFEPGQKDTPHHHAGPVFGYVLEGEYEHAINDEPIKSYKAGDTFYEPTGSVHRVAQNPSAKTRTRLLAVILHPRDAKEVTVPEKAKKK